MNLRTLAQNSFKLKTGFKAFLASFLFVFTCLGTLSAQADELDDLLQQIDQDIAAKRLSSPAGNNALEKIQQFRALAPFDQRVHDKAYTVAELYVGFAESAMSKGQLTKSQGYLDKAWDIAYLAQGLEDAQTKLDRQFVASGQKAPQVKAVNDVANATKAAKKVVKQKQAQKPKPAAKPASKVIAKTEPKPKPKSKPVAKAPVKTQPKPAAKKATAPKPRQSAPAVAQKPAALAKSEVNSLAKYPISEEIIADRNKKELMKNLQPICQSILDNEASVLLSTQSVQDYRWLTVRLTLCLRRLDKSFRLRHSHESSNSGDALISLLPPRERAIRN